MKIGIITFHWANNYGAVLQAYALQTYLESIGHDVSIIDYCPVWSPDRINRMKLRNSGLKGILHFLDGKLRNLKFNKFRKNYLNISSEPVRNYDLVLTGSDQVFNPDIISKPGNKFDAKYLLNWPGVKKKASYSASFGNSSLNPIYYDIFKECLSSFSAVSVREVSGLKILSELGIDNVSVSPDPTILIDRFPYLMNKSNTKIKNYIFNFIFHNTDSSDSVSIMLSKSLGGIGIKRVITLPQYLHGVLGLLHPGVKKWISTIRNARFVVTDSFHCTLFCILQHVPFVVLSQNAWGKDWAERIRNLLESVGLPDRLLIDTGSPIKVDKLLGPIDWHSVDCKIAQMRENGQNYLRNITRI